LNRERQRPVIEPLSAPVTMTGRSRSRFKDKRNNACAAASSEAL
jgi:hypothetical protein